ncbi:MAG: serine hydrolase [Bryobacteraceae bacterium]
MGSCALLLGLALAIGAAGQLPSPLKIAAIEKLITAEMSLRRIPGLSIAIGDASGQIWTNGYGMADLENFVPAKGLSVYRTASIAKPMTRRSDAASR